MRVRPPGLLATPSRAAAGAPFLPVLGRLTCGLALGAALFAPGARAADPMLSVSPARTAEPKPAPAERAGTLIIAGGGKLPDGIRARFIELAGGKKAHIVVIPTASERADQPKLVETYLFFQAQDIGSVTLLHTRDRKQADDPAFVKPLAEATGVWLTGGDQSRLSATYHGTAVEKELQKVMARGGVVGGTSAGAAVMSALMITGGTEEAEIGDGFGLLTGVVVDQHFWNRHRLNRLLGVLAKHPECPGVGIDEETALIVQGQTATVMGKGNVRACLCERGALPASVQVLKDGEKLDIAELVKAALAREKPKAEGKEAPPMERASLEPKR